MSGLLGPADVRRLAAELDLRPTKARGQNFVIDPNSVRRIAAKADLTLGDHVLEVGPGLGSLTLALLPLVGHVTAVEVDPVLAEQLPRTMTEFAPEFADRLTVICADALDLSGAECAPTSLVANLPYNVAVPVLLESLARFVTITHGLVMVQKEVADRLCAVPGSRVYGIPSAKLAWFARASAAGSVPASVFWPAPRVESGLVRFVRHPGAADDDLRAQTFAAIDAAFGQRRKVLRTTLAPWAGSPAAAEDLLRACGIEPTARGETLSADDFAALASRKSPRPNP